MQNQQSWQWPLRALFPHHTRWYHETLVTLLYDWPPQWALYIYESRVCVICVRTQVGKQAQGMAPTYCTSHIHGHTKNQGHVWPSYFSKVSWQRKSWPLKGETDSKGMMIFARPSGSGYPNQLEAVIPYGSTKAYSQRPTLLYKDFHIPLTRLTWLVWDIQVCSIRTKISLQAP